MRADKTDQSFAAMIHLAAAARVKIGDNGVAVERLVGEPLKCSPSTVTTSVGPAWTKTQVPGAGLIVAPPSTPSARTVRDFVITMASKSPGSRTLITPLAIVAFAAIVKFAQGAVRVKAVPLPVLDT
jgi:hypothetical protein